MDSESKPDLSDELVYGALELAGAQLRLGPTDAQEPLRYGMLGRVHVVRKCGGWRGYRTLCNRTIEEEDLFSSAPIGRRSWIAGPRCNTCERRHP